MVIQADTHRRQGDNVRECFEKLNGMIRDVGKSAMPGEMEEGKEERIQRM